MAAQLPRKDRKYMLGSSLQDKGNQHPAFDKFGDHRSTALVQLKTMFENKLNQYTKDMTKRPSVSYKTALDDRVMN